MTSTTLVATVLRMQLETFLFTDFVCVAFGALVAVVMMFAFMDRSRRRT